MSLFQRHPIITIPTGTTDTSLWHKGLPPIMYGTCSGTRMEQFQRGKVVPDAEAEQEHYRNDAKPYPVMDCGLCSIVPFGSYLLATDVCNQIREGWLQ